MLFHKNASSNRVLQDKKARSLLDVPEHVVLDTPLHRNRCTIFILDTRLAAITR